MHSLHAACPAVPMARSPPANGHFRLRYCYATLQCSMRAYIRKATARPLSRSDVCRAVEHQEENDGLNTLRLPYRIARTDRYDCSSLMTRYLDHVGINLGDLGEEPDLVSLNDLAWAVGLS